MTLTTLPNKLAIHVFAGMIVLMIIIFTILAQSELSSGLLGLGIILIALGTLIEVKSKQIWQNSLRWQNQTKTKLPWYHRPSMVYYRLNVWVLWPVIIVLGLAAILTALALS